MDPLVSTVFLTTVLYTTSAMVTQSCWEQDTSNIDTVFTGDVIFTEVTSSLFICAQACKSYKDVTCRDFSYTTSTGECRGYGQLLGAAYQGNTTLWKYVCRLAGYTYDPDFKTCLRIYTSDVVQSNAAATCAADTAYLITPDTTYKLNSLLTGMNKDIYRGGWMWWTSGYDYDDTDVDDFRWPTGEAVNMDPAVWHTGEPSSPKERCLTFFSLSFLPSALFNDLNCTFFQIPFACQEDLYP